jgi:hypothetical protein
MKLGTLTPSFRIGGNTPSRIYRGSDLVWESFTPLSLSPALWLSDSGTNPAQWDDISGNNRHAVQATPANMPSIVAGAINGKQIRRFDGGDYFSTVGFSANYSAKTIYIVQARASTGFRSPIGNRETSAGWVIRLTDTGGLFAHPGTASNISVAADSKVAGLIRLQSNGSSMTLQIGSASASGGSGSYVSSANNLQIGADGRPGEYYAGDIAEILIFPTALSTTDRQAVETYLNAKWAIY